MLVKGWMTTDVITIDEDTSMLKAGQIMKENNIKALPVMRDGKLMGIVTDQDIKEASPSKLRPWMCMSSITCCRSSRSKIS